MKQKDIALIIGAIAISAILSFIISSKFLVAPAKRQQQVEVVPAISAQFTIPGQRDFNDQSINPTQLIVIGDNSNQTPFNQTSGQ